MTQPPRRRGRSRLPLAVAVALPTIMVTPPDFGDPAGARSAVLTVSDVTHASATLTITGHQSDWYYKDTRPSGAACSPVAAGTSTAELTGLTPETSNTYQAYSDRDCAAVLATAPAFTTPAAPAVILSTTDLTVTEGSAGAYTVALAAPPSGPVAVTIAAAGDPDITISAADCDARTAGIQLCFTTDDYDTAQTSPSRLPKTTTAPTDRPRSATPLREEATTRCRPPSPSSRQTTTPTRPDST